MSSPTRIALFFLAPALIAIGVFFFVPVLAALLLSFTDFDIYALATFDYARFIGLRNYERILADPLFWQALRNTLYFHVMIDDSAGHRQNDSYAVRGDDVERLRSALAPFRRAQFAAMGDRAVSVEEIVGELKFFPLRFPALSNNAFLKTLHQDLRMVVEAAIVSKEAMRRGLHQRSDVRRELNMWIDAMQAEKFLKYLIDSLSRREGSAGDTTFAAAQQAMRKAVETINTYLAQLAAQSGVTFDLARLCRVAVTPSSMVTRRFIGFDGSMMATPMIMQLWEWLDVWMKSERISP